MKAGQSGAKPWKLTLRRRPKREQEAYLSGVISGLNMALRRVHDEGEVRSIEVLRESLRATYEEGR